MDNKKLDTLRGDINSLDDKILDLLKQELKLLLKLANKRNQRLIQQMFKESRKYLIDYYKIQKQNTLRTLQLEFGEKYFKLQQNYKKTIAH